MKKALNFTILCVVLTLMITAPVMGAQGAFGQKKSDVSKVVSINIMSVFVAALDGQYEMVLDEKSSLCIRGFFWGFKSGDWSYSLLGAGAAYRMYMDGKSLEGVYVGPLLAFNSASMNFSSALLNSEASASNFSFGPGVEVGNQWVWKNGFTLDLGISATYYIGSVAAIKTKDKTTGVETGVNVSGTNFSGVQPGLRLALGFAF